VNSSMLIAAPSRDCDSSWLVTALAKVSVLF
jgi:hypothetical protein